MAERQQASTTLEAVEQLGYKCTVSEVVALTGAEVDAVEMEMATLLRDSGGLFEIDEEGGGEHVAQPRGPQRALRLARAGVAAELARAQLLRELEARDRLLLLVLALARHLLLQLEALLLISNLPVRLADLPVGGVDKTRHLIRLSLYLTYHYYL